MTDMQEPRPIWEATPAVESGEPDWAAMADSYERDSRRKKQIRTAAACVVAAAAVGGIVVAAVQVTGSGPNGGHGAAAAGASHGPSTGLDGLGGGHDHGGGASPSDDPSGSLTVVSSGGAVTASGAPTAGGSTAPGTPGHGGQPGGGPAAGGTAGSGGSGSGSGGSGAGGSGSGGSTSGGAAPGAPAPAPGKTTPAPQPTKAPTPTPTPAPTSVNPYTPGQVCGSGFGVVDSHSLGDATIYLMYNNGTGYNCVVTMATHPNGKVAMNATLAVQNGPSASNPGNFDDYAGPVTEHAPHTCVTWGGSFRGVSWTSGWSHCT
ncbi:hypothetical protein ACFW1A_36040 [Kitasatospora sp. NPDC058965]|uniref:hypothetical protein n=1 Tax=Kitasatospora sp. NPDC058965 TaxID=3346682 RepID=UPI0036A1F142